MGVASRFLRIGMAALANRTVLELMPALPPSIITVRIGRGHQTSTCWLLPTTPETLFTTLALGAPDPRLLLPSIRWWVAPLLMAASHSRTSGSPVVEAMS